MTRTITVKGVGAASVKPDYVVLKMALGSPDYEYKKAMAMASEQIAKLTDALVAIGFEKDEVKTTDFKVDTEYERVENPDGTHRRVFEGYEVRHLLKLGFDFDMDRLSEVISTIAGCMAKPEMKIQFTVKDATKVSDELLCSAATDARAKAEVISKASGVGLGQLLRIDYNWGELDVYSHTRLDPGDMLLAAGPQGRGIDFEPDDIDVSDTVAFEWEIA